MVYFNEKNNLIDKTLEKIPEVEWLPASGRSKNRGYDKPKTRLVYI